MIDDYRKQHVPVRRYTYGNTLHIAYTESYAGNQHSRKYLGKLKENKSCFNNQ